MRRSAAAKGFGAADNILGIASEVDVEGSESM
jgi:hypothetical protein